MTLLDESIDQFLRDVSLDDILHTDSREDTRMLICSIRLELDPCGAHVVHPVLQARNHVDERASTM